MDPSGNGDVVIVLPSTTDCDTIAGFAEEMSEFLKTSELTETRAFVKSFVKGVLVKPGRAAVIYSLPMPEDSPIGEADTAELALSGRVIASGRSGGPRRTDLRTLRWEASL